MTDNTNLAKKPNHRGRLLLGITLALATLGLGYLAYWTLYGRFHTSTDDAYVAGNRVAVTSQVPGTVTAITVDSTDHVSAGQPLVRLDRTDARIALGQAEAELADAVRHTQHLFGSVPTVTARLRAADAARAQAQRDWHRAQRLFRGGALARAKLEQADTAWIEARAQTALTESQLRQTRDLVHGTGVSHYPAVLAAEAAVRRADVALQRCVIRAPVSGYVAERSVELGQQVQPGRPLMLIVPLRQVWVNANFKEQQLRAIRIGQPARLIADWYGSHVVFHGHVVGINPGSGSAFSLLPPENASGNWIKIVQRVPVRIVVDPGELMAHPLRIGLSMSVTITTRNQSGALLPKVSAAMPRYRTSIYRGLDRRAEKRVDQIVRANLPPARPVHHP